MLKISTEIHNDIFPSQTVQGLVIDKAVTVNLFLLILFTGRVNEFHMTTNKVRRSAEFDLKRNEDSSDDSEVLMNLLFQSDS